MNDIPNILPSTQFETVTLSAVEAISRAEVDIQISTAKRYPRNLQQVKTAMLSFAGLDQETAESCFYTLPRAGKNIQGPSVRLAEIAVASYKNLRVATRVIDTVTTGDSPHALVQAVCMDLENNIAVAVEKRRRITKKRGKTAVDEDDINLAVNAGSAIAFRDAVFKVIPGALVKPVYEHAKTIAIGDAMTLADRRIRAIDALAKMGVGVDRILGALEKEDVEDIDVTDLETLFGLRTAVKDGQTSLDEAFPPPRAKAAAKKESKSEKAPEFVSESVQEDIAIELNDASIKQGDFIEHLRSKGFAIPAEVQTVHGLDKETATVVASNLRTLLAEFGK